MLHIGSHIDYISSLPCHLFNIFWFLHFQVFSSEKMGLSFLFLLGFSLLDPFLLIFLDFYVSHMFSSRNFIKNIPIDSFKLLTSKNWYRPKKNGQYFLSQRSSFLPRFDRVFPLFSKFWECFEANLFIENDLTRDFDVTLPKNAFLSENIWIFESADLYFFLVFDALLFRVEVWILDFRPYFSCAMVPILVIFESWNSLVICWKLLLCPISKVLLSFVLCNTCEAIRCVHVWTYCTKLKFYYIKIRTNISRAYWPRLTTNF